MEFDGIYYLGSKGQREGFSLVRGFRFKHLGGSVDQVRFFIYAVISRLADLALQPNVTSLLHKIILLSNVQMSV